MVCVLGVWVLAFRRSSGVVVGAGVGKLGLHGKALQCVLEDRELSDSTAGVSLPAGAV